MPLVDSIEPEIYCDIEFLNVSVFNTYMTDIAYVSCPSEIAALFIPLKIMQDREGKRGDHNTYHFFRNFLGQEKIPLV